MSLTDNTTELEEVLTLANSIEVPTIKSISVNGVEQTPDENRNVDIEVPSASITAITVNGVEQTPEEGIVNIAAIPPITEYADWVSELRTQCYTKGEPTAPPSVETVQTTMGNVAYAIARRGANGTLNVGTPTRSSHATTKEYVDNAIANIEIPESGGASLYKHEIQIMFIDPEDYVWGVAYCTVYSDISTQVTNDTTFLSLFDATTEICNIPATGVYLPSGPSDASGERANIIKLDYNMHGGDYGYGAFYIYKTNIPLNNDPSSFAGNWYPSIHNGYWGWRFEDRITQIL